MNTINEATGVAKPTDHSDFVAKPTGPLQSPLLFAQVPEEVSRTFDEEARQVAQISLAMPLHALARLRLTALNEIGELEDMLRYQRDGRPASWARACKEKLAIWQCIAAACEPLLIDPTERIERACDITEREARGQSK